jgi:hypothetical protein
MKGSSRCVLIIFIFIPVLKRIWASMWIKMVLMLIKFLILLMPVIRNSYEYRYAHGQDKADKLQVNFSGGGGVNFVHNTS